MLVMVSIGYDQCWGVVSVGYGQYWRWSVLVLVDVEGGHCWLWPVLDMISDGCSQC